MAVVTTSEARTERELRIAAHSVFFLYLLRLESYSHKLSTSQVQTDVNNQTPIAIQQELAGESAVVGDVAVRVSRMSCHSDSPMA